MICKNNYNARTFSSVSQIPDIVWQQLACDTNLYFHKEYLQSLENNNTQIDFSYIVLVNKQQKAIAFATLQIIGFDVNSIKNDLEKLLRKVTAIARKIRLLPKEKPLKFLVCGNIFVSGEHGIFIKDGVDKNNTIKQLGKAIQSFASEHKDKEIAIFILKDFIKNSLFITNELLDYNYYSINVEPNMKLEINKSWNTFDDYLAALKTKFRVKAKKALHKSDTLHIIDITTKNIDRLLPKMTHLYEKVVSKADFNFGDFNLATYKNLIEKLGDCYILKAYYLEDTMIGFMSGLINGTSLDAHFVGIDYQYNREYAVYQRMLYEYIMIAIDKKLKTLNFARTASEIKSSVGAIPEDLTVYIRHKKSITNKLLRLFLTNLQPTKFNQKFPFKNIVIPNENNS
ncbi:MAG: GNAT family N-acetyltransferase [Flavobacteriaceae bacterium]|nr:MAG: GNAT family N-acetyltransferase [Flavobacteriaceae bacterium]